MTTKLAKTFLKELCDLYFDYPIDTHKMKCLLRNEGVLVGNKFVSIQEIRAVAGEYLISQGVDTATPPPNDYPYWLNKLQDAVVACGSPSQYKTFCSYVIPEYESVGGKTWEYREGHRRDTKLDQQSLLLCLQGIGRELHSGFSVQYPSYKFHLNIPTTIGYKVDNEMKIGTVLQHNSCMGFLVLKQKVKLSLKPNVACQDKVTSIEVPMILITQLYYPAICAWRSSVWNISFV